MTLPYGFKAQANRIAVGLRRLLGLMPDSPIDVWMLLDRLRIDVIPLAYFYDIRPEQVAQLRRDSGEFSALLFRAGDGGRIILLNDDHSPVRQNSSVAHEASHSLLAHSPEVVSSEPGCRNYDRGQESEANFLAGCILLPNEAAKKIVMSGMDLREARESYGVSDRMLQYRLNASGARIQRRRRRY